MLGFLSPLNGSLPSRSFLIAPAAPPESHWGHVILQTLWGIEDHWRPLYFFSFCRRMKHIAIITGNVPFREIKNIDEGWSMLQQMRSVCVCVRVWECVRVFVCVCVICPPVNEPAACFPQKGLGSRCSRMRRILVPVSCTAIQFLLWVRPIACLASESSQTNFPFYVQHHLSRSLLTNIFTDNSCLHSGY